MFQQSATVYWGLLHVRCVSVPREVLGVQAGYLRTPRCHGAVLLLLTRVSCVTEELGAVTSCPEWTEISVLESSILYKLFLSRAPGHAVPSGMPSANT